MTDLFHYFRAKFSQVRVIKVTEARSLSLRSTLATSFELRLTSSGDFRNLKTKLPNADILIRLIVLQFVNES